MMTEWEKEKNRIRGLFRQDSAFEDKLVKLYKKY
jgi:hypothetical protein